MSLELLGETINCLRWRKFKLVGVQVSELTEKMTQGKWVGVRVSVILLNK